MKKILSSSSKRPLPLDISIYVIYHGNIGRLKVLEYLTDESSFADMYQAGSSNKSSYWTSIWFLFPIKKCKCCNMEELCSQPFLQPLLRNQPLLCSSYIFICLCFCITTWVCIIATMHSIYIWSVQKQWFHKSSLSRLCLWLLFYSNTFQVINTTCGTPNSQQQTIISLGYPLWVIIPMTDY